MAPPTQKEHRLTEDSTLFSLEQLTRTPAASQPPPEEDSGLIDLGQLSALPAAPVPNLFAPPPLAPLGATPLGTVAAESTLNGVSAVAGQRPTRDRFRIGVVATAVVALCSLLGWSTLRPRGASPPTAGPATTLIVYAPAVPPARAVAPKADPVLATAAATAAHEKHSAPPVSSVRRAGLKPKPRNETPKPVNTPPKPTAKDPCSHCDGDLACAMRCSVRGSR